MSEENGTPVTRRELRLELRGVRLEMRLLIVGSVLVSRFIPPEIVGVPASAVDALMRLFT